MRKKLMAAALLAALSGAASAQGYAGALIGLAKISTDCGSIASCDDTGTGYKAFAGYQVTPNLAVEAGYTSFGKATAGTGSGREEISSSAFSVIGAFRLPLMEDWTGIARLGLAGVKAKRSIGGADRSETSLKLYTGLGLEYALNPDFKINAALDLSSAEIDGDSGTVYLFGVGAQMGF